MYICLTLLASFFLPSHLSIKNMYMYIHLVVYTCIYMYLFQTTFKLGLSYLPLATAGLAALQAWSCQLPSSVVGPHFRSILPALDDYLKTRGMEGE